MISFETLIIMGSIISVICFVRKNRKLEKENSQLKSENDDLKNRKTK